MYEGYVVFGDMPSLDLAILLLFYLSLTHLCPALDNEQRPHTKLTGQRKPSGHGHRARHEQVSNDFNKVQDFDPGPSEHGGDHVSGEI